MPLRCKTMRGRSLLAAGKLQLETSPLLGQPVGFRQQARPNPTVSERRRNNQLHDFTDQTCMMELWFKTQVQKSGDSIRIFIYNTRISRIVTLPSIDRGKGFIRKLLFLEFTN